MDRLLSFALLGILIFLGLRALRKPLGWAIRLGLHSLCGFFCLWILNQVSPITGITLPINPITLALSGLGGLPGVAAVALLEFL